jgi:hypothetical protein
VTVHLIEYAHVTRHRVKCTVTVIFDSMPPEHALAFRVFHEVALQAFERQARPAA